MRRGLWSRRAAATLALGLGGVGAGCAAILGLSPADPTPACVDTTDQMTIAALNQNYVNTLVGCALTLEYGGDPVKISGCIQTETKVSNGCANCTALIGLCSTESCASACPMGPTPTCEQCVATHCNEGFIGCGGFPVYACLGASDSALIADAGTTIAEEATTCANDEPPGSTGPGVACLEKGSGLSPNCSLCYILERICGISTCSMCVGGMTSPACTTCVSSVCKPLFQLCTGMFPADAGPDDGG